MGNLAMRTEGTVARSLTVLIPLIKEEIRLAHEAAELASAPHWKRVGDLLEEAQHSDGGRTIAELADWAKRNFGFSRSHTLKLKALASSTFDLSRARSFSDAMRATGKSPRGAERGGAAWHEPVVEPINSRGMAGACKLLDNGSFSETRLVSVKAEKMRARKELNEVEYQLVLQLSKPENE